MKFMKILELSLMILMMALFLGFSPGVVFLIFPFLLGIKKIVKREKKRNQDKETLESLSELATLLEQGDSPLYAYEKLGRFPFPSFMLHPEDELFRQEIFQKQFQLFEKTALLKEEIHSEMAVIRLRMGIMKLMPLALLLVLRRMMGDETSGGLNLLAVLLFLLNHWLAEHLMEGL